MKEDFYDHGMAPTAAAVDIMTPDEVEQPQSLPHHQPYRPPQRYLGRAALLLLATCFSTFYVGVANVWGSYDPFEAVRRGFIYAASLMTILLCHEMGHFLQSCRYGVFSSYPYFLPIPIQPFGTMGAVIFMEPRAGHRRALFDIGISGPLAGLVPTLIFCIIGIRLSTYTTQVGNEVNFPLLFVWLFGLFGQHISHDAIPVLHPTAFAGWVGLFITSLNLIPIGQLDGGHVLYALMRKKARYIAGFLLFAVVIVVATNEKLYTWAVMLMILFIMGPFHPPTANDDEPLGILRYIIGWATLAFVVIGFTPMPFKLH